MVPRLAVARYQPNSVPGLEFSDVVATDFVQPPPERLGYPDHFYL